MILKPCQKGNIRLSVVKSCCGNVIHSLISKKKGSKKEHLPGFEPMTKEDMESFESINPWNENCLQTTHMDHITYVCYGGDSRKILAWYHEIFGMRRFLVSKQVKFFCIIFSFYFFILSFLILWFFCKGNSRKWWSWSTWWS